jgi:hypothetical protein
MPLYASATGSDMWKLELDFLPSKKVGFRWETLVTEYYNLEILVKKINATRASITSRGRFSLAHTA